jgi:uncharacterized membrane protein
MASASFFGRIRTLGNDPPSQGAFVADVLRLAAAFSPAPLLRPTTPDAEDMRGGYLANVYQDSVSMSLESLRQVQIRLPGGGVAEVGTEATVDWQHLHAAIQPEDGPLWSDIKSFLSETGLALSHAGFEAEPGELVRARESLREMSDAIGSALKRASRLAPWLDPYDGQADGSKQRTVLRQMLREMSRASRYVVVRNEGRSWVFLAIGWFPVAGELRLGVAVETDPAKRGLRQVLLEGAEDLRSDWMLSQRDWAAVAKYADPGFDTAEASAWIEERVGALFAVGLMDPRDRWGRPLDRSVTLPAFPEGRGGRQVEYQRRRSIADRAGPGETRADTLSRTL